MDRCRRACRLSSAEHTQAVSAGLHGRPRSTMRQHVATVATAVSRMSHTGLSTKNPAHSSAFGCIGAVEIRELIGSGHRAHERELGAQHAPA